MTKLSSALLMTWLLVAPSAVLAQGGCEPPSSCPLGNVHSEFGAVEGCTPPACGTFTIDQSVIKAAFSNFTDAAGEDITFSYCGAWWSENVGTDAVVEKDFCTSGAGANQDCEEIVYKGVTLVFNAEGGEYSISSQNQPLHEAENYCNIDITPPEIGTDFTHENMYYSDDFTLTPSNSYRCDLSGNQVGVAVNGVAIFKPFMEENIVAIYDEPFDSNSGSPAHGQYHYHGYTTAILDENIDNVLALTSHSGILGVANDGFLIYGPVGYFTSRGTSPTLKLLESGYECTTDAGAPCSEQEMADPYMWRFTGRGDLDECNGRFGVTPEFPDGIYYYVMSVDDTGYPSFPGVPYCTHSAAPEDDAGGEEGGIDDFGFGQSAAAPFAAYVIYFGALAASLFVFFH